MAFPSDDAELVLDEELFLTATRVLAALEEREEPFEFLNAVYPFTEDAYLAARFAHDVDREIGEEERRAIGMYVAAVYLVEHQRASLGDIGEIRESVGEGPTLEFIRSAAWAYLSAWSLRYGGLNARLVVRGTLVDPTVDDIK